jgi:peptidoglycan-N-acetylmuramic acid deacetylase
MPTRANNIEQFNKEFTDTEAAYKEVTGLDMPKYFRPPMGEFSEKTLQLTQQLGYKTIFWSFAHKDWEVNNQPSVQQTHDTVLKRTHNGCILLLHAVSKSNTEALDSIIKDLKAEGYRFGTLDELK